MRQMEVYGELSGAVPTASKDGTPPRNTRAALTYTRVMVRGLLRRMVPVHDGEVAAVAWSAGYFYFLLFAYYVVRPVREAMGVAGGVDNLPWLFTGTLVVTFLANPLFAAAVTHLPRRRFVPLVYRCSSACLLAFAVLLQVLPDEAHLQVGRALYVWTAVFALFAVSVFWGFMADVWSPEQGKRLFGAIGLGGTLGAMTGSFLTARVAESVGPVPLLLGAAVVLEAAVWCVRRLVAVFGLAPRGGARDAEARAERPDATEGGILAGMRAAAASGYLRTICLYLLLFTTTSTIVYFHQAGIVRAAADTPGGWTAIFAELDLYVNLVALVFELFLTARLIQWLGLGRTLAVLPAWSALGFAALALRPALSTLVVVQVLRRGLDYGLARPAREVLFTVLPREAKYKAKSFIDTFVYRGGDAAAAWGFERLVAAGLAAGTIAWGAVGLSLGWLGVSVVLGRMQALLAAARAPDRTG